MSDRWIERYKTAGYALLFAASFAQTQLQLQLQVQVLQVQMREAEGPPGKNAPEVFVQDVREAERLPGKSAAEVLVQDVRDLAWTVQGDEERQKDLEVLEKQL